MLYVGAIVLVQGRTFLVKDVVSDPEKIAYAMPAKVPYFTKFRDSLSIVLQHRAQTARGGWIHCGPAILTVQPLGFKKIWRKTLEVRGDGSGVGRVSSRPLPASTCVAPRRSLSSATSISPPSSRRRRRCGATCQPPCMRSWQPLEQTRSLAATASTTPCGPSSQAL